MIVCVRVGTHVYMLVCIYMYVYICTSLVFSRSSLLTPRQHKANYCSGINNYQHHGPLCLIEL